MLINNADMNPVAAAVRFPDQLVEMEVVHHPDEPFFAGLFIRNMNVGRFARQDDIWGDDTSPM
ncbi:MAG: hypothetical protein MJZ73_09305 [Bacteroidaceae bacterium]|nr:hypothetical protein [Bacteroidaceae bacterium]